MPIPTNVIWYWRFWYCYIPSLTCFVVLHLYSPCTPTVLPCTPTVLPCTPTVLPCTPIVLPSYSHVLPPYSHVLPPYSHVLPSYLGVDEVSLFPPWPGPGPGRLNFFGPGPRPGRLHFFGPGPYPDPTGSGSGTYPTISNVHLFVRMVLFIIENSDKNVSRIRLEDNSNDNNSIFVK